MPSVSGSVVEKKLWEALSRVKDGTPQQPALLILSKKRKLKLTISSVAKEAGVSRTLIGHEGCRYPKVRLAILETKDHVHRKSDARTINSDLRQINRLLENRWKLLLSENAALICRMQKIELEHEDKSDEIKRIKARHSKDPNHIVGTKLMPKGISNIVKIFSPDDNS